MTEIPFRGLGTLGLNSDIDPRSLPTLPQEAMSDARNVRFEKGSIQRGPRFRLNGTMETGRPTHVQAHGVPNSTFETLVGYFDGKIHRVFGRDDVGGPCIEQDVTPTTHKPFNYPAASSSCTLEDVVYWSRPDHKLWAMLKNGERFAEVEQWGDDWRCRAIRAFQNVVVAINVSRGGRTYPCMIKTSDLAAYGVSDQEWVASTTNSASENLIGALADRLVDGLPLRQQMFLYTQSETWVMTPNYTSSLYDYQPAFNLGMISTNCGTVVNGTAYIMGREGLWMHNSATQERLSKGRFDNAVYKHMIHSQEWQYFVVHNPKRGEVMFCFVSDDPKAKFPVGPGKVPTGFDDYPGCNMALTYNYVFDTGVLDDLPYVVGGGFVSPYQGVRWDQLQGSWGDLQGTWDSLADHTQPAPIFVSSGAPPAPPVLPAIKANDDSFSMSIDMCCPPVTAVDLQINATTRATTITEAQLLAGGSGDGRFLASVGKPDRGTASLDTTTRNVTFTAASDEGGEALPFDFFPFRVENACGSHTEALAIININLTPTNQTNAVNFSYTLNPDNDAYFVKGSVEITAHSYFQDIGIAPDEKFKILGYEFQYEAGQLRQDMEIVMAAINYGTDTGTTQAATAEATFGANGVSAKVLGAQGQEIFSDEFGYMHLFRPTPFTDAEVAALPPQLFGTATRGTVKGQAILYIENDDLSRGPETEFSDFSYANFGQVRRMSNGIVYVPYDSTSYPRDSFTFQRRYPGGTNYTLVTVYIN